MILYEVSCFPLHHSTYSFFLDLNGLRSRLTKHSSPKEVCDYLNLVLLTTMLNHNERLEVVSKLKQFQFIVSVTEAGKGSVF